MFPGDVVHIYMYRIFVSFFSVKGTFKVTDIPAHMKTSFVKLSTGEVPPNASPEKSVIVSSTGKLAKTGDFLHF